jgi:Rrf2 family nitric oxide-sensitive transcriptional repressor
MRLTQRTDYALRVLMHLAVKGDAASVGDIAARFRLSPHHVMKVAQELAKAGWVDAQRGRGGGLTLAVEPRTVKIGDVVRRMEPDFRLVECFEPAVNHCVVTKACRLRGVLEQALELFLRRLDAVTLADLMEDRRALAKLLHIKTAA